MSYPQRSLNPDEKVKAGKLGANMARAGLAIAAIFLGISIVLTLTSGSPGAGHTSHWARFLYAYVIGWSFAASIGIGMMWLVLIHHLTRSRWSVVVRRIAEAMAASMSWVWIAGLVFVIPLLAGYSDLYYWASVGGRDAVLNPSIAHKSMWLSPAFFAARYALYGIIFWRMSTYFRNKSRAQDESGDPKLSDDMRVMSGPMMILYAVTTVMVSFDVLMSMAPKWYSTIYGVNFWGSSCIGGFSALALIVLWIQRSGRLTHSINEEHYHDIGKWMYSFTFFWAYTAFAQFLLQWYGNIPEETVWYKYRMFGDWQWVSIAILVGYWAFPFILLMSRWTKRIVPSLVFFAVWQLVFHWLDLYWNVMPSFDWYQAVHDGVTANMGPLMGPVASHHVGFSPVDITVWLGLCGVLMMGIGKNLTGNLIPVKDPTLGLSLAHEQL